MATTTSSGFALLRENGDVLYFDAITALAEQYSAAVSKHPLANGAKVSDHTTFENPRFSISGILSDADFNTNRPTISTGDINGNKQYLNNTQTVKPVTIFDTTSKINKVLPEVVAQFTKDQIPPVLVTPQPKAKAALAVKDNMIDMITNREVFTFFEYRDGVIPKTYTNCVLTRVDFKEDERTGEGIFPELEFEQVSFPVVQNVQVTIKSKGRQVGKTTTVKEQPDPSKAPSSYTKESATDYRAGGSKAVKP